MSIKPLQKPPEFIPEYCPAMKGTGPEFIGQYTGMYVYVWTVKGDGFWLYPTDISGNVLRGYIWRHSRPQYIHLLISKIDCLY